VQEEYGRLRATPGAVAVTLAAIGLGGVLARHQLERGRRPRLLGIVEPRRLRRTNPARRVLARLRGS
jgi:hypothetical protein